MATLIYALQNFTGTDSASYVKGNTYTVADSVAYVAYQRGQAQPASLQEDANLSTLNQLQYDAGATGVAGADNNGGIYDAAGDKINIVKLKPNARLVMEGDSLTDYEKTGQNWQIYLNALLKGYFYRPYGSNQAQGGETLINHISSDAQVLAVKSLLPDVITLMIGTNDINGATTDITEALWAKLQDTLNYYVTDGLKGPGAAKYVIVGKVPPRNDATWNDLRESIRVKFNALIDTLPNLNSRYIVAQTDTDNAGGKWDYAGATSWQSDLIHESWVGMRILAYAFYNAFTNIIDVNWFETAKWANADNLAPNPRLLGTGGNKTGNAGGGVPVPTGDVANLWRVQNNIAGLNVTCSKDSLNGAIAQKLVLSGTTTNTGQVLSFGLDSNLGLQGYAGEAYELMMDVEVEAGASNIRHIRLFTTTSDTPASVGPTGYPMNFDKPFNGVLRTTVTLPLAVDTVINSMSFRLINQAVGDVNATIRLSRPYFRKVVNQSPI